MYRFVDVQVTISSSCLNIYTTEKLTYKRPGSHTDVPGFVIPMHAPDLRLKPGQSTHPCMRLSVVCSSALPLVPGGRSLCARSPYIIFDLSCGCSRYSCSCFASEIPSALRIRTLHQWGLQVVSTYGCLRRIIHESGTVKHERMGAKVKVFQEIKIRKNLSSPLLRSETMRSAMLYSVNTRERKGKRNPLKPIQRRSQLLLAARFI